MTVKQEIIAIQQNTEEWKKLYEEIKAEALTW